VNDQAAWEQAVASVGSMYVGLPPATAAELNRLIEEIMRLKQMLVELVLAAGSADVCRTCGGECCRYGKYHVSVLDMMAYLKSAAKPVSPDFSINPACPYSDDSGCTMAARYRPLTCVIFNCQQVEDQLTTAQLETFHGFEQELRNTIARAGTITGMRLDRALLLSCN
jgi:hypothetical protein